MTETGSETIYMARDFMPLLHEAVARATFDLRRFGTISGHQLGQMYRTYTGLNRLYLRTAKLRLDEDLFGALADSLRCLLCSYIENDRIGNGGCDEGDSRLPGKSSLIQGGNGSSPPDNLGVRAPRTVA